MLRILYGTAGTGKSAAVMDEIRRGAQGGRRHILIVPEQYSHEAERELCAVCGDGLSLYAEVLSFTGLWREVCSLLGGAAEEYLDKGGRLLCMALAAGSLYSRLRVYGAARRSAELQTMLLDAVDEFKSACVTSDKLLSAAEDCGGALGEKLRDLGLLLEAYDAVAANGSADPADRLSVLAQRIQEASFGADMRIFIDGFTDFTAQEKRVIEALLLSGADMTVCLSCDGLDGGSEVFALSRMTAAALLRFASGRGIEALAERWTGLSTKRAPLSLFSESMFSFRAVEAAGAEGCINIIAAPDMNAECELAASEALRLVRDTGCRWRDIAVCAGGFEDYRLLLESAFSRYGVPLYTARRTDMLSKPLPALISAAYEIILGGWEADDVFEYLRTGFCGLDTDDCDELEGYVFTWQLHGSAWTRDEPWSMHPDGYGKEPDELSAARLGRINALRETARRPLMHFAEHAADTTALGQAQALAGLLDELGLAEKLRARAEELEAAGRRADAGECAQLWDITVTALEQCAAVLGGGAADAEYFGHLFTLMLSRYDIGTIPVSLDCVTAGEAERMRRRSIKHLIVLGATDERIPGTPAESGVFSSDERRRLLEMDIDLGGAGDSELWRAFSVVYSCLSLPSDSLTLCYPVSGENGAQCRPAFVVNRARALFGLEESLFDVDSARLNARAPALELAAQSLHGGGGTAAASAAAFFAECEPERLRSLESAANRSRGSLSRASVRALYGDRLRLSASRIDKFASCRFSYFMQYALRARPHEPAGFTAPETGTFMHRILEQVTREVGSMGGYKNVDDGTVSALCGKYVSEYISTELNDFRDKSKRFEHLFRRLTQQVRQIVLDLADELRRSDFTPLSFELDFSGTPELEPIELGEGEDSLVLSGIADRVDGWLHEGKLYLRVVDYKTGRKKFELSDVLYGMNLQMLLYLFSLGENGKDLYGHEIVPAGVLYVPARDECVRGDADMSDAQLEKKRGESLRRSGLILDDPEVIAAMERSDEPRYIPVKLRKNGESCDALASAERFGALAKHIERTLRGMAAELRAGSIAADPYYADQQKNACLHCDYFDACRFRDGENGESMRITPRLPATKVWSVLEGGEADGEV